MSSHTNTELHAGCSGRVFLSFLPEPFAFAKTRLVSRNHSVDSGAPPSISSASYGDHDSLLRTPRRFREAGCPFKRSVSTCDHGMTRAALHASGRTLGVQLGVRFIFPQHPVHPYSQLACDHDLGQRRMFLRFQPAIIPPQLSIGPATRFPRGKHVASYLGLIPREHSSGGHQKLGSISKQGNTMMRTLLVEAAQTASRFDEELRRDYGRLKAKKHSALAKVMVARKLAVRMYWMLRENKSYTQLYAQRPVARMQGSPGHSVVAG